MEQNAMLGPEAKAAVKELALSQYELGNFHKRTMSIVYGMLLNAEEFNLHPCVRDNLEAIQDLGNS